MQLPQEDVAFTLFPKSKKETEAEPSPEESGYTINYNTVSVIEYIRFASKICSVNFIFDEQDLNFTVTVVSKEPITAENVMGTLVQILRIHGLQLIEQEGSLVIHKSADVKQLAKVVTEKSQEKKSPLVTRIFRLQNAKPESVSAIIKSMISSTAILETSPETRQLILTDVTANVDKIALLIENLDSPHTTLDIKSYTTEFHSPESLTEIIQQLMNPIAQGFPYHIVPAETTSTIYVVSTPELADRTLETLKSLDLPQKKPLPGTRRLKSENIFVYKLEHRTGSEVLTGLSSIESNLNQSGVADHDLIDTMESAKWIHETNSIMLVGSKESIDKVKEFLSTLDVPSGEESQKISFFVYKPQSRTAKEIWSALEEMAANLKKAPGSDAALIATMESAKINIATNTISFSGIDRTIPQVKELLATIDSGTKAPKLKSSFYIYKLTTTSPKQFENSLKAFAEELEKSGADEGLYETISGMKYVKETNSYLFTGSDAALKRLQEILPSFEGGSLTPSSQFLNYTPINQGGPELLASLKDLSEGLKSNNLADPMMLRSLETAKWIPSSGTILFTGDPVSLKKIQDLLATVDTPQGAKGGVLGLLTQSSQFFVYKPINRGGPELIASLKDLSEHMKSNHLADPMVIKSLESAKWVSSSGTILFTGDPNSLKKIQDLLATVDLPQGGKGSAYAQSSQFLNYKPIHRGGPELIVSLKDLTEGLKSNNLADPLMLKSLESAKWVPSSGTILFTGDPASLKKIQDLLVTIDIAQGKKGYFLYKLQSASGEEIEDDLDNLIKKGIQDPKVIDVINNLRYVKETNSLLLTGDPSAIEEVKELIAKYDYPRESTIKNSNFYMYKPQHLPADQIEKSLRDVGKSLTAAGLADPSLLTTINSVNYVETTNSLIFTGPSDTLTKIESLLKDVDVPPSKTAPIQHVGAKTFLLYKLKNASYLPITSALKAMAADLKKSGTSDKDFLAALNTMKYIKETNSLMFTGEEDSLKKVEALVEKFDVTGFATPSPTGAPVAPTASNFFVYKPQSLSGPELEKLLQDFADNLKQSGLADPDLFNAIASMRWVEKTSSLLFAGSSKALDQIKELLRDFDIPSNLPGGPPVGPLEPNIQAIDNTSFLVYKLQFHKGDEIQGALRQIAKDLMLSNAPVNQNLLNSINSIQWLEVTNSLLCSGDQDTLTRLRELIKNLDVPLKQVFIEVLMIETSLTNALTFGLEWGAQYQYKNKFSGQLNNLIPSSSTSSVSGDPLSTALSKTTPTTPPTPPNVPILGPGFDLGVIGEIIRHDGNTYLSIGSLLAALQTDAETTIVMTPKLITQDGRTSTIFQGSNIPFAGSFVSSSSPTSGSNATIGTTNIEYRDIGISLTLTPVLGNSDIVTLDIQLDQTSTTTNAAQNQITINSSTGLPTSINGITTSKVTMQTTVHVPDDHFLVLSGVVNNSNTRLKTGIPCLGTLPLIGAAFSQDNESINNTSVVIFLRPHIINSLDDMTRITKHEENFFRDQTGTPNLEQSYNEAMELIKTVDDE